MENKIKQEIDTIEDYLSPAFEDFNYYPIYYYNLCIMKFSKEYKASTDYFEERLLNLKGYLELKLYEL